MKQIKIGQIGRGSFGKKILAKLEQIDNISIEWVCGSQDKWCNQSKVDWVIVASPNEFHYEQTKYFLESGTNVFCEKPGTLYSKALKELIKISKINNLNFYIDDVLIYENVKPTYDFIYKKWGGLGATIIDRMAYHHFYLIYDRVKHIKSKEIKIIKNDINHKSFEINFLDTTYNGPGVGRVNFNFEYDFNWHKEKMHNIETQYKEDALYHMLNLVFQEKANFNLNLKRSLFATELSEEVKNKIYGKCAVKEEEYTE